MQTHDAVEFCQAVLAGSAARRSEEGRGRGAGSAAGGRPTSPQVRRTPSAVSDGPLEPVAESDDAAITQTAAASSPFEKQSKVSWDR